jgi:hypothetical protein
MSVRERHDQRREGRRGGGWSAWEGVVDSVPARCLTSVGTSEHGRERAIAEVKSRKLAWEGLRGA